MVKYIDKNRTYIGENVILGDDVIIYPDVYIEGNSVIESGVILYPFTYIVDSKIGKNTKVYSSHIFDSEIGENNNIGPYSHIRPNTKTSSNAKIGSFTETKNIVLGNGSKIPHLSYIGDTTIGDKVNIGCGVITANYDGKEKHKSVIEDNVFVGCNSVLVSPVKLCKNSYIAAGSTITRDVPSNTLAIAREKQVNKEDYIHKD